MKNNTAIVLLLLSVGLFYTFTDSQYQEVKELHSLANEYQNVLQNISKTLELRDSLHVTYAAIPATEIDRMNKVLPNNVNTVRLALDLDGIASSYGISIKNIGSTLGTNNDAGLVVLPEYENVYKTAKVSFSFISDYKNFKKLLADLERNLRIMDISSISFQAGETSLNEYEISVETYWLK